MSQPGPRGIGKSRLEALADGIFAVAMTLLVLDLKVPPAGAGKAPADLPRRLAALWPRVLAYVVSFLVLGVYWLAFVSTRASLVLCVLTPVLFILPGRVDRDWWKGGHR